jgi:rSAM/selenodomain-associated transferase 1
LHHQRQSVDHGDRAVTGATIGVMARAPRAGQCKTRLEPALGPEGAARLYEAMLLDTLCALASAGARRLVVMAAPENDGVEVLRAIAPAGRDVVAQRGEGLGSRLANACTDLGGGGAPVVLVASDTPTMQVGPLAHALCDFHAPRRVLLGPSDDGGYYLIGLTTAELGVLRDISWSTPAVLRETRARCVELGLAVDELPSSYDVDEPADVERVRRELAEHPERAPRTAAVLAASARSASSSRA